MSYKALDLLRHSSCLVGGMMKIFLVKWYSKTRFRSKTIVHVTAAVVVSLVSAQGDEDPVRLLKEPSQDLQANIIQYFLLLQKPVSSVMASSKATMLIQKLSANLSTSVLTLSLVT